MKESGFTLIELLVVISIIGVLASVVLASLSDARIKARDTKRIQDLQTLRTAIELYYDKHGHYPDFDNDPNTITRGLTYSDENSGGNAWTFLNPLVTEGFIGALPVDPINEGSSPWSHDGYTYSYLMQDPSGQNYDLIARLEQSGHSLTCEATGTEAGGTKVWQTHSKTYKLCPWGTECDDWCDLENNQGGTPNQIVADH